MFALSPFKRRGDLMNSFFGDDFWRDFFPAESNHLLALDIKADISESDTAFVVDAEIPGVDKDNLSVELKDDVLTITAEKNEQNNDEGKNYVRRERRFGKVSRSFYVTNVDVDRITADYNDGILKICLPKLQQIEPGTRKIDIS